MIVTAAPLVPAAGVTEVTTGASLSVNPVGAARVVFDPPMAFAAVGLPEEASWVGVNSFTVDAP